MAWTNILQIFFPIGSVYFSTVNSSPASTIGGTWTQITNRFIRTGISPTTTGGSDTHSHTYGVDWLAYYCTMANYNQGENETFLGLWDDSIDSFTSGAVKSLDKMTGLVNTGVQESQRTATGINHFGTTMTITANNMPSYYTVCMWVRTA